MRELNHFKVFNLFYFKSNTSIIVDIITKTVACSLVSFQMYGDTEVTKKNDLFLKLTIVHEHNTQ